MFYIQDRRTQEFIGFKGAIHSEYPDAQKFETRAKAEAELKRLRSFPGIPLFDLEVAEG